MAETRIEIVARHLEVDRTRGHLLAKVQVPAGLRFFEGHFPGRPILPGVVELSEIVLPSIEAIWPDLGFLSSIKRLKFKELIVPNDELELVIRVDAPSAVRFWLRSEGRECAVGTLEFTAHE
jgi:3-hydroxymyristoyl/3-hydroxydecanoyl-(acyl carrier protein) dehydratase